MQCSRDAVRATLLSFTQRRGAEGWAILLRAETFFQTQKARDTLSQKKESGAQSRRTTRRKLGRTPVFYLLMLRSAENRFRLDALLSAGGAVGN